MALAAVDPSMEGGMMGLSGSTGIRYKKDSDGAAAAATAASMTVGTKVIEMGAGYAEGSGEQGPTESSATVDSSTSDTKKARASDRSYIINNRGDRVPAPLNKGIYTPPVKNIKEARAILTNPR